MRHSQLTPKVRIPRSTTRLEASSSRGRASSLLPWLALGLALRLFFLPIALHPDLVAVYARADAWLNGQQPLSDFHLQSLPIALHALWIRITGVDIPTLTGLSWSRTSIDSLYASLAEVLASPAILAHVMLWKLPYLLAELAAVAVLMRILPRRSAAMSFRIWMVHPVLLYGTVLFGKHESWMLLLMMLGLLAIQRRRPTLGFLILGLAAGVRLYPLILLPPAILAATPDPRRRVEYAFVSALPMASILAISGLGGGSAWLLVPLAAALLTLIYCLVHRGPVELLFWIATSIGTALLLPGVIRALANPDYPLDPLLQHGSYFLPARIPVAGSDAILLFGLAYGAVCIFAHRRSRARLLGATEFRDVWDSALLAVLAYFALGTFNPQYALLLMALALPRAIEGGERAAAYALQITGLLLHLTFFEGGSTTLWLFAPLAPDDVPLLPGPLEVLPALPGGVGWASVGRTLLSLGCAWTAWRILREHRGMAGLRAGSGAPRPGWLLGGALLLWPVAGAALIVASLAGPLTYVTAYRPLESWHAARPLDGLEFTTRFRVPRAVEIRSLSGPRHLESQISLREIGAEPDRSNPAVESRASARTLEPGALQAEGTTGLRLSFEGTELERHRSYRLEWQAEAPARRATPEYRLVFDLPRKEILDRLAGSIHERVLSRPRFLVPWLGSVLLLLATAVVLAYRGRATRHP